MRPPGPALTPKPRGTPAPASRAAAPRRREPATARAAPWPCAATGATRLRPRAHKGPHAQQWGFVASGPAPRRNIPAGASLRPPMAPSGAWAARSGPPATMPLASWRGGSFDGGARWHVHLLRKRARDAGVRKAAGCQRPERGIACQPWQAQPQKQASAQPCARGGDWRLWRLIKGRAGPVADPAAFPQAGSKGASHGGIKARPWGDDVF